MHLRLTKILLVCVAALFATLVAFNNITDYGSNYEYVRHVLSMDTTFPENNGMWRRIESSALHHAAYVIIIAFEAFIAALCWIGAARLWGSRADPAQFARRKTTAVWGLVCAIVLW
ncbi:MAG: DUF2165 domain-containing protein, partial [Gammaproteobacteria bacterium]|nr:DUF2165 domain-containing protein [Gammaproteobacteria bacterium]